MIVVSVYILGKIEGNYRIPSIGISILNNQLTQPRCRCYIELAIVCKSM